MSRFRLRKTLRELAAIFLVFWPVVTTLRRRAAQRPVTRGPGLDNSMLGAVRACLTYPGALNDVCCYALQSRNFAFLMKTCLTESNGAHREPVSQRGTAFRQRFVRSPTCTD